MPEYLAPGVYVEEVDSEVKPIPGIPTSIDPAALESLAADFRKAMQTSVPGWTDPPESDPGVTLVEMFAFVAESPVTYAHVFPYSVRTGTTAAKLDGQNPPTTIAAVRPRPSSLPVVELYQ